MMFFISTVCLLPFGLIGAVNPLITFSAYVVLGGMYLLVVPLLLFYWMNNRWNVMGKFERLFVYGLVFLFFPGLVLFAPFLNLRMNGNEESKPLTRAKVFQIGLIVFVLGGLGYEVFQLFGFESIPAGIATQLILILIIFAWTASYLFRVFTGNMTFMEQRKRYREAYEKLTDKKIREKFEAMTEEEKIELLKTFEEKNIEQT